MRLCAVRDVCVRGWRASGADVGKEADDSTMRSVRMENVMRERGAIKGGIPIPL